MAELPAVPALQSSELSLSCVGCGEKVEELKCLPCLHSLALCEKVECREKILHRSVSCQICEEVFSLSLKDLSDHPFALRKALSNQYRKEGAICQEEHEEERSAVSFCSTCDAFICQECVDLHKISKFFKKHEMKPLQKVFEQGGKKENLFKCSKHKENCKLYCHTCEELICHICSSIEPHRSHKVSYIDDELGESNKTTLTQCLSSVRTQRKAIRSALQEVQDSKASLQQQSENALGEIAGMKEHLFAMVTARCDGLAAEVREAEDKGRRKLERRERELKVSLKKLDAFHCLSEDMSLNGTTEEQLSVTKKIVSRMSSLSSSISMPRASIQPSVGLKSCDREEVEKYISSLGSIHHGPHPPNCTMEGVEVKDNVITCRMRPWIKKPLHLKVKTRDERGNECRGGEKVLAVLRPVTAGVPVFGKVTDMRDGTYEVQFASVPSDKCHLSVTVGRHDVAGSPVEMKVVGGSVITAVKQEFKHPSGSRYLGVAVGPDGLLYCSDNNGQVTILNRQGQVIRSFKVKNGGLLHGIALSRTGNVIVSNWSNGYISIYTAAGEFVRQFRGKGKDQGQISIPYGLTVNKEGHIFVADLGGNCVSVFIEEGTFLYRIGHKGKGEGEFNYPRYILITPDDLVYVTDGNNHRIQVFQQNGQFIRQFGNGIVKGPEGIAVTSDGHIVVASYDPNKLSIFTQDGQHVHEVTDIGLNDPCGVAVDSDGLIYIADSNNSRVVVL